MTFLVGREKNMAEEKVTKPVVLPELSYWLHIVPSPECETSPAFKQLCKEIGAAHIQCSNTPGGDPWMFVEWEFVEEDKRHNQLFGTHGRTPVDKIELATLHYLDKAVPALAKQNHSLRILWQITTEDQLPGNKWHFVPFERGITYIDDSGDNLMLFNV